MRQDTFRRKTWRRFFRFLGILPLQKKSGSRRADFSAQGGKGAQSGKPFAGAARFFSVGLCGLRFAEPPLRRRIFPHVAEKGAKRQAFCGRSPFFFRGALRVTVRRAAFAAGGFFSHGAEKGAKRQAFCGRSPFFLRGALRVTARRAAFAAGGFFRMGRKRAQSGKPFAAQPGFFSWGFAGYGSPSRLCGGRIFPHGAEKGAPQSAERALALFQRE